MLESFCQSFSEMVNWNLFTLFVIIVYLLQERKRILKTVPLYCHCLQHFIDKNSTYQHLINLQAEKFTNFYNKASVRTISISSTSSFSLSTPCRRKSMSSTISYRKRRKVKDDTDLWELIYSNKFKE